MSENVKNETWVAELLERLPYVEWDRFTVAKINDSQVVDVYGWIDRDDEYKDFIWSRFWTETESVEYTTSSDEYSEQIQIDWFGKDSLDNHVACNRVENYFDIPNAVELQTELIADD